MTYLEAAHLILAEARKALTEAEIVSRALRKGLISPRTRQPERSIGVVLKRASQNPVSSFEQTAPHTWQLKPSKILEHPMSMREAALKVLTLAGKPLHYQEITRRAIRAGLIRPEGKTPAYTLRARVGDDMQRNEDSPFERVSDGTYGLKVWPKDLRKAKRATKKKAAKPVARIAKAQPVAKPVKPAKPAKAPKIAKAEAQPAVRKPRAKRQAIAEVSQPVVAMKRPAKVADQGSLERLARLKAAH
jgi:hypothetical protein